MRGGKEGREGACPTACSDAADTPAEEDEVDVDDADEDCRGSRS